MRAVYLILLVSFVYVSGKSLTHDSSNDVRETCNSLTFACQDLHVARKCKSVSACIEIWEGIKVPKEVNNEICDICLQMVKEARDQLLSNETQEELKQVFEGSCNLLPIKAISSECIKLVDEFVPALIEMLASRMDPNQVCTVSGLCNNGLLKKLLKQQYVSSKPLSIKSNYRNAANCKSCTKGMMFVRRALKFIPENDFTSLLLHSCMEEFQGNHAQCDKFVKQAAPIVYNFLRVGDPSVFCSHMEQCPAVDVPPPSLGDNQTCEFCEALISYVKTVVSSKSTEEEFRTAFNNMCADLKEFSTECKALVDEYFDQFYDFLMNNLDPQAVCTTLGLCQNLPNRARIMMQLTPSLLVPKPEVPVLLSKAEEREHRLRTNRPVSVPMVELVEARPMRPVQLQKAQKIHVGIEVQASKNTKDQFARVPLSRIEGNGIDAIPILIPNTIIKSDVECSLCKAAVMFIETQIEKNRTEDRIRKALDQVCTIFPAELASQCTDFINIYTDTFITLIIQEANPNVVCSVIKACSVQDAILPRDFNEEHKHLLPTFVQCELCKKVMEYLENYLGNNKTEAKIKQALEKVCSELPTKYAAECKTFVDEYSDIIITLLAKEIAPTMVCAALGLCPGQKSGGEVQCTVCQYVLHYLQTQLMQNSTEEEIKAAVERVCATLPKSLADNCDAFVEEFGSSLIVLIAQKIDPSVVCVNLKICPATQGKHIKSNVKIETCDTCEMVVNFMDKLLENDEIDSDITQLVEKVCGALPGNSREECSSIIDLYGPYILQMIGQVSDGKSVCQAIQLCSRTEKNQLLGAKKCTFGPSYWCQSAAHATACNAHEYCKKKVWKM